MTTQDSSLTPLTKDEALEIFHHLNAIEGLLGSMPYRDGKNAAAHIKMIRETIAGTLAAPKDA